MTVTHTKLKVIKILNDIKKEIFYVLEDDALYLTNFSLWTMFFHELMIILRNTLDKIEDIYFTYILNPRLSYLLNTLGQRQDVQFFQHQ